MICFRIFASLILCLGICARQVKISTKPIKNDGKGQTYALLVTGGVRWFPSYKKEANVAAAYALLKKNGIPAENIVVMSYDFAVNHPRNPCKGQLFNSPDFVNIYDPQNIDYKGLSVTPENVLNIMKGKAIKGGNGRILNSTSVDRLFLYFTTDGLKSHPALCFQDITRIWVEDFMQTLRWMKENGRYSEMVIYLDTDFGNAFLDSLPNDLNVYAVTNTNDLVHVNYTLPTFCKLEHCGGKMSCLASKFSFDWQNVTAHSDLYKTTFRDQMAYLREHSDYESEDYKEALLEFGDKTISDKPIGCFLASGNNKLCVIDVNCLCRLFTPTALSPVVNRHPMYAAP